MDRCATIFFSSCTNPLSNIQKWLNVCVLWCRDGLSIWTTGEWLRALVAHAGWGGPLVWLCGEDYVSGADWVTWLGAQSQCGVDYYVHIRYTLFTYYYNVLYNGLLFWNKPGHPAGQTLTPAICSWGSCRSHIELIGIMFSTEELPWKLQGLQRSEQSEHLLQLNSLLTWNSLRFTQTQHYLFKGITICYRQLNGFSVINLVVYCFKLWDFCKLVAVLWQKFCIQSMIVLGYWGHNR